MKVLAIETSCDDTSLAVVSFTNWMISCDAMISFHQIDIHQCYGGVVPELASREHLNQFLPVLEELCLRVRWNTDIDEFMKTIDLIAVTHSPGLPWSLVIGRTGALVLSSWYDIPYKYINHLHGHIFSWLVDKDFTEIKETLVLSVSWWHSDLSLVSRHSTECDDDIDILWHYGIQKIWSTRDDAIWEVFDKISRLLGGPYPWWVWISQQAWEYDKTLVHKIYPFATQHFKKILLSDTYDFSFSWMKSQAYTFINSFKDQLWLSPEDLLPVELIRYIAYEFQETAASILCARILKVLDDYPQLWRVALVGWVSANTRIREKIQEWLAIYSRWSEKKIDFVTPVLFDYCTDNAAMIGAAAIVWNLI